jgi:peroxiredoxin Q/BCP
LPNLTLKDEKNEDIQIADLASEGGVVLFLVPKADTRKHL